MNLQAFLRETNYEENMIKIMREDGINLEYVKYQTSKICLEAVKQNSWALQFVKNQTEQICLEAVKRNGNALQFVENQTEEICIAAVKQNPFALQFAKERIIVEKGILKGIFARIKSIC